MTNLVEKLSPDSLRFKASIYRIISPQEKQRVNLGNNKKSTENQDFGKSSETFLFKIQN